MHVFDSWLAEICRTWFPSLSQLNSYSLLILNIIFCEYLSNYTTVKVSNLKPTPLSFHSFVFPNLSLFYKTPKYYHRLVFFFFLIGHRLVLLIYCFCNSKLNTSMEVSKKRTIYWSVKKIVILMGVLRAVVNKLNYESFNITFMKNIKKTVKKINYFIIFS